MPPDEQSLVEEIKQLRAAVSLLTETVKKYMTRDEAYEVFSTRHRLRKARTQLIIGMLIAIIVANSFTAALVSTCFLRVENGVPGYCSILPGYDDSLESGKENLKHLRELLNTIKTNTEDIEKLQKQITQIQHP